jgi:hypothetical protein
LRWPRLSLREMADRFDLGKDALLRHSQNHLSKRAGDPAPDPLSYFAQMAAQRRREPVCFGRDQERETPAAPPRETVPEVWPVCGRLYTIEYAAPDVPRPPQIEPTIKRGIPYTRPQRYSTWED